MKDYILSNNTQITSKNSLYNEFLSKVYQYYKSNGLLKTKYENLFEPYDFPKTLCVVDGRPIIQQGAFCYEEIEMLETVFTKIKHDLYSDYSEKLFISHSEKDAEIAKIIINLLHSIGIARPSLRNDEHIFCSSYTPYSTQIGENNKIRIKQELTSNKHIFILLLYSDNYFSSKPCMNEMGAVWALSKKYQEILIPGFKSNNIGGLLENTPTWFYLDNEMRLNDFKDMIVKRFSLSNLRENDWHAIRSEFITCLQSLSNN